MRKFLFYTVFICLAGFYNGAQAKVVPYVTGRPEAPSDTLSDKRLDSIIVLSTRAGANTPVTYTTISSKDISNAPSSHSLPMLLGFEPSVVATTEGGLGLGYTKFSVRGTDPSRINIALNGITINDSESQQVFWVNLPSISGAMQSVQLQRGVGTSANGVGAFGAVANMQTKESGYDPYGNAEFSLGSYHTYMTAIGAGTGQLPVGKNGMYFSLDGRHSYANTKGYIRNAKADLNSLFLSASLKDASNILKLIYIYGDQSTGITWEGCPIAIYRTNRKYNVAGEYKDDAGNVHYYDNETDNYTQHHVQLHYARLFSDKISVNATLHFTKGDGYYENYKASQKFSKYGLANQTIDGEEHSKSDFIIRNLMDNSYYAGTASFNYDDGRFKFTGGMAASLYDGDHFGRMLWSKYNANIPKDYNWYDNNGRKGDVTAYIKAEYEIFKNFVAFADVQYRRVDYKLKGDDKDFVSLNKSLHYNFFSPKVGVSYKIDERNKVYASFAIGNNEPNRSDIKENIKSGSSADVTSERMYDYEVGYRFASQSFTATVNLYAMEYHNQLVATGRLSEVGYTIQENIPHSHRRGIELAARWQALHNLAFAGNITLSENKLKNYTLYTDTYDNATDWNPVPQTQTYLKRSDLILSPKAVGMLSAVYLPAPAWRISLNCKYVGRQYMDNSSSAEARVPSYFVMGMNLSRSFTIKGLSTMTVSVAADNLLNRKYYSYGWLYRAKFASGEPDSVDKAVFSQAPLNFIAKVSFEF